jgi:hypothetical protein
MWDWGRFVGFVFGRGSLLGQPKLRVEVFGLVWEMLLGVR